MNPYRLYQVDAFTTRKFRGNPAGVVPNADGLASAEMQAIARELNNSETAFVFAAEGPDHDVVVRFFTPTTEVPSCGHATVAAHYVRAVEQGPPNRTVVQKTGAGNLRVDVVREGGDYTIVMTQGPPEFGDMLPASSVADIAAALGASPRDFDARCPVQIVSTGHSKVLVGLQSRRALDALAPDLARLCAISARIGCNGFFVFTLDADSGDVLAHGRMFAPAIGIPEDPVTGNGNGPLGAYLARYGLAAPTDGTLRFRARQGDAVGRPGVVDVTVEMAGERPAVVRVAGRAVVVFRSELEL